MEKKHENMAHFPRTLHNKSQKCHFFAPRLSIPSLHPFFSFSTQPDDPFFLSSLPPVTQDMDQLTAKAHTSDTGLRMAQLNM